MTTLPPDRGHVETEGRHEHSENLDELSLRDCIDLMIDDHRAVPDALAAAAPVMEVFIGELVPRFEAGGRLIYVGAGTSGRLGVLDASECPPTFQAEPGRVVGIIAGGDAALRASSEGLEDDADGARVELARLQLRAEDTVLGIAAGGTTPYVLGALRIAAESGCLTALLTCAAPPADLGGGHHVIRLQTGPEILAGSTRLKAGSATKLALNIITTTLFIRIGKVYSNLMVDLRATNDKLRDRAIRLLMTICPGLSRSEAARRLDAAEGNLKAAIVMCRRDCSRAEAQRLLADQRGRLRPLLDH